MSKKTAFLFEMGLCEATKVSLIRVVSVTSPPSQRFHHRLTGESRPNYQFLHFFAGGCKQRANPLISVFLIVFFWGWAINHLSGWVAPIEFEKKKSGIRVK